MTNRPVFVLLALAGHIGRMISLLLEAKVILVSPSRLRP